MAGQEPVPAVQQALHLGTLLVEGQAHDRAVPSPLVGETWSVAVRLLGHAGPGEVLVSPQLGRLVTGWYVLQARPGLAGGGPSDQMGAYNVEGLASPHAPQVGVRARVWKSTPVRWRITIAAVATALELLPSLPDTSERMQQELCLQVTLGRALIATRGYAAPEVEHAYARALELCRQVGETSHLFQVLWGLRVCYLMRAEFQQARALAEEMLTLAQHQHDMTLLPEAHYVLANVLFYMGELDLARTHTEQSIALYDPQQHRARAPAYGVSDLGAHCLAFSMHSLVLLGYPDQACSGPPTRSPSPRGWRTPLA